MPYYDYKCKECEMIFEDESSIRNSARSAICSCGGKAPRIFVRPPSAHGLSDGPGSGRTECVFDRPDPLKECRRTAKIMEAAGELKSPAMQDAVKTKLDALAKAEPTREKRDYQIRGGEQHPMGGNK